MKNCSKCGQSIPDNAKFCSFCGEVAEEVKTAENENTVYYAAPEAQAPAGNREEEQKHLDSLSNRLKWERIAWKVSGIIFLVCSIILLSISTIFGVAGIVGLASSDPEVIIEEYNYSDDYYYDDYYNEFEDSADVGMAVLGGVSVIFWMVYFIIGIVFLPIAIVNLVMAKKVGKYRAKLYTDCTDGVKHATSVGSIVLGAIFNEYALIAIIINFILTKKNKAVFDRIKANQSAYNNPQY